MLKQYNTYGATNNENLGNPLIVTSRGQIVSKKAYDAYKASLKITNKTAHKTTKDLGKSADFGSKASNRTAITQKQSKQNQDNAPLSTPQTGPKEMSILQATSRFFNITKQAAFNKVNGDNGFTPINS